MRRVLALVLAALVLAAPALAQTVSGPVVPSVNGKRGNVVLGAADVGAAPCPGSCVLLPPFFTALATVAPTASQIDVRTAFGDAPGGPITLAYESGHISTGDPLAALVQARYGRSSGQMAAVFTAAGAATTPPLSPLTRPTLAHLGGASKAADLASGSVARGNLGLGPLATLSDAGPAMRTATGSTTPRSIATAAADVLQGADNGMKCDGVTDDGPALQTLVNRVTVSTSNDIQLPYGKCLINTGVIINSAPVRLRGHSWSEFTTTGTTLYTTNPAITPLGINPLVPNGIARTNGSSIEGIAISQQQPLPLTAPASITAGSNQIVTTVAAKVGSAVIGSGIPTEAFVTALSGTGPNYTLTLNVAATATTGSASVTTWAPTVYPPFIYVRDTASIKLRDIYGFGVYDGISLYNVGRDEVTGIYGQFFHNALTSDVGYDLAHWSDFHIWPFWSGAQGAAYGTGPLLDVVIAWQQANMDTIVIGRQDGATIRDMFFFAANAGVTFKSLAGLGPATNIMVDQVQCDSTVHCIKNVSGQGATLFIGALNSFGQRGVSSATPYPNANVIYADPNSAFVINGGDIKMGFADSNVVQLESSTLASTVYLHSLTTYLQVGNPGSAVIRSAAKNAGAPPDLVSVDTPLNISLSSGSYLPGVNWATTNAQIRIPGLDYQIIESPTAAAFAGNSYAIENARPKVVFEADDGNAISSMTIRLPKQPYDGMEVVIMSTVAVTAVTINDPNGRAVIGAPTSLAANTPIRLKWTNTGSQIVWFRN